MRLQAYWHALKNLLTSPDYYLKVITAPFSFSLRFFVMSMILLGLAFALKVNQKILPDFQRQAQLSLDELRDNYPPDLEINWLSDRLTSSSTETIKIPYPSFMEKNNDLPKTLGYFIPQDITADEISDNIDENSLIVITSHQLLINDLQGTWNGFPLSDLMNKEELILNKQTIGDVTEINKQGIAEIIAAIKKIDYLIMPVILIMFKLWMALIEGILIFLFFKLNHLKISFSRAYQLSLHLVVIAEIISQLSSWIYPQYSVSMFTAAYWVIFSYIFWTQRKQFAQL